MSTTFYYVGISLTFLILLLLFFVRHRRSSIALTSALRYDHKIDLRPFFKTHSSDVAYLPRFFDPSDLLYLQKSSFPAPEIRRLRKDRQAAAREFLISLREDFDRILYAHQYLARCAAELSGKYEWIVLRERVRFAARYRMVRWSFEIQCRFSNPSPLGIEGLAEFLEDWKSTLEEKLEFLNPLQLGELKSDLQSTLPH